MGRVRQTADSGLYGRVLQRLGHALAEAGEGPGEPDGRHELELNGLSCSELELIRAYLSRDARWLSGWHAAAEEQALIDRQVARTSLRSRAGWRGRQVHGQLQRSLACALCGADVPWPESPGAVTCSSCGSHLLRGRQRMDLRRH